MDLRHLKYFIAVAEEGNIGRAAERLNISQPPLTRQIHQLEHELKADLFVRHPRGVELTHAGHLLLEEARNIANLVDQLRGRVQRANVGELGRLDVGIFGSAILDLIPKIVREFKHRHPGIQVYLHNLGKAQQAEALKNRSLDLAFNRLVEPVPGLVIEEITRERIYLAIQEDNPLVRKGEFVMQDIKDRALIVFPTSGVRGFAEKVIDMCNASGFAPNVVQSVGDSVTGIALVASGFGVCLVPESVLRLSVHGVAYLPLSKQSADHRVDLSCIYRENDRSPVLENFLTVARELANGDRRSPGKKRLRDDGPSS